ncbi:uncharacterized protein MELLADRAFT_102479 [Melampsora larici-populina 98AG31]|uniref:Uncharacterized protein n=1 Tax=Melampsora larici-populina (strain 98AG31 / pathotype 3-4-7) TaxID=747676 RepID=F4R8G3_MELLP|nr:uncharacterized protein MELLADRAFT_102479 [Melampsora larici-populina 98AG31]EGG11611.1 hypothetical protein MELLADRAFT_102479 [Melampsora larici-populina 98AG31]
MRYQTNKFFTVPMAAERNQTELGSQDHIPIPQAQNYTVFNEKLPSPSKGLLISRVLPSTSKDGRGYHFSWVLEDAGYSAEGGSGKERNEVPLGMPKLDSAC